MEPSNPNGMGGNGAAGNSAAGNGVAGNGAAPGLNGNNRVRELRENRLMTQAQLAKRAKVALRTIHSVEKGMNCRMDTKRKILLALGLRFEDKDQVFPARYPDIQSKFRREF